MLCNQPINQPTPTRSACNLPVNNCWDNSKFQVLEWRNIHDELQQNWKPIWVYRITLKKLCRDIINASGLILNTWLEIIWTCFWEKFRFLKVQKPRGQKRIVFLPVGGGVAQFEKQTRVWKHFATLRYVFAVCFILFLKSCVSCQALAEAVKQNSTLTSLNLKYQNIGDEEAKAWCLVRMGTWGEKRSEEIQKGRIKTQPYEREVREMTKGNAKQRWFPDAFIRLKFVMTSDCGILMYLACIGQILVEKRNNS